jgi:non-reducing end alpha-L-arabinofuranosidase
MRRFLQAIMRNNLRALLTIAMILALLAAVAIGIGRRDVHAASYCNVTYTVSNQWQGGFGANIVIQNTGSSAWTSWTLTFIFPASGQAVTQGWNGTFTQSGQNVTVTNMSYNANVAVNGTANPGFNGAWTSSNPVPTSFSVNGNVCGGTTTPTNTPGATNTPVSTNTPISTNTPVSTNTPTPTSTPGSSLPCDIYATGGTPCVAAHSTVRALLSSYNGPLYQVKRSSDSTTKDIGLLSVGGYVNAATQVSFCSGTSCTITKIYDQTANHNDLPISWGGYWKGPGANGADVGADAMALPITIAGHQAFGIKATGGVGYRIDNAKGVATGSQPEGIYMITSSNYVNNQCCFDYGSGENSHTDTGNATMNAIYFGTACWFGTWGNNPCVGSGPWVEADLENGMYHTATGSNKDPNNSGIHYPFVSAWLKNNGVSNFTLKYGNAQSGSLTTPWSGALPNGYSPMRLDSSILLGTGGDNSPYGIGEFFEGAMTSGFPTDATENAVQASIVAAGYGK